MGLFDLFTPRSRSAVNTIYLAVALPEGTRFIAQDSDGAWFGFAEKPVFVEGANAWQPLESAVDGRCAYLAHGPQPFEASITCREVRA